MTTPTLKPFRLNSGQVTFLVPEDWTEESNEAGMIKLRTVCGGEVRLQFREFRKPPLAGTSGPSSKEMVAMQAAPFGGVAKVIGPGRAIASHPVSIGEPGKETQTHVWHLANQVAPWHHETVLITFAPAAESMPNPTVIELLDRQLAACEFANGSWAPSDSPVVSQSKPWWRFW